MLLWPAPLTSAGGFNRWATLRYVMQPKRQTRISLMSLACFRGDRMSRVSCFLALALTAGAFSVPAASHAQTAYDAVDTFIGTTGEGNTFPGSVTAIRHDAVEPRYRARRAGISKRNQHPRLQPDPSQRCGLPALWRLPDPALDRRTQDEPGNESRRLHSLVRP